MSATHFNLPTKACHNCRRRRWRCDRSLPSCQKCLSAGTECLGYGKLFVWNRGVASRGKMMGKGYEDKMVPHRLAEAGTTEAAAKTQDMSALVWDNQGPSQQHYTYQQEQPQSQPQSLDSYETVSGQSAVAVCRMPGQEEVQSLPLVSDVHRALTDPLVNDLDRNSRYYLYHFATQLCEVMVLYDVPGQNPIRDLIPATAAYPLLLHIIVANSAFHVFNITRNPMGQSSYQGHLSPTVQAYYQAVSRFGGPLKSSYRDALVAKQHALSLLAKSVASVNAANIDLS